MIVFPVYMGIVIASKNELMLCYHIVQHLTGKNFDICIVICQNLISYLSVSLRNVDVRCEWNHIIVEVL